MVTQFQSNLPNVQQEVCIEPSKFQDGQISQTITVTYQNRFTYNYRFIRIDENGNYCYMLIVVGAFGGRKKKKITPPPPPPCTPVDTVFQGIVTSNLQSIVNFRFLLNAISIGDFIFDPSIPQLTGVLLPGYTFAVVTIDDTQVTFTITKTGSACELNGQVATIEIDAGDGTGEASQIVVGVCCP